MKGEQSDKKKLDAENASKSNAIEIPSVTLPKGGGALKGIDEKFEVNSANGTANFSIPIPVTPGRNGFTPSLAIAYSSGGGNSSFGLGWSLSLPSIQRQTDKSIPQYNESEDDTYMFSGAEDLVPCLKKDPLTDEWVPKETTVDGYTIKTYRPRIEGSFARIEKITHASLGTYWKVTSRDNTVTFFGRGTTCRVADPKDARRIFQWLPEFSYDDKGNWIHYHYKTDSNIGSDGAIIGDASIPNYCYERNRKTGAAPYTNTYLKQVTYGNHRAYYRNISTIYDFSLPENQDCFFQLVFDYGEHDASIPTPTEVTSWAYREDAFSSYRSGFEIRTNRLCKRLLMFHHFPDETQFTGTADEESFGTNYLVRSLDLTYTPSSINHSGQAEVLYLTSATQNGYCRKSDGSYSKKSLPPTDFTYQTLQWNKDIKTVSEESSRNAPVGLTNSYQWTDLYGEGISGILSEQGTGWFYKSNLGDVYEDGGVTFCAAKNVFPKPSFSGLANGVLSIQDLESNGQKQVVVRATGITGYFELSDDEQVKAFKPFEQSVNINTQDQNVRLLDLTGDGKPDLVITEDHVFTWYASTGKKGYTSHKKLLKATDEEEGPAVVFANEEQVIFLADMSGDGLTDIVRIRNSEICYWANMGYGKFSAKVTMANAPLFDYPELFNPRYVHLADVSGTGATDIIYLGKNLFKAYINLSGNAWSDAHDIDPFLTIDNRTQVSVVDLLGTGTSCIVWSSDLPAHSHAPMRYIDLMDSKKPHVMIGYKNNLGKETTVEYKSSTHYYNRDKLAGKPWITKLPFPVQVISKQTVDEKITNVKFSTEYKYHHGYYDHAEKEFRGFGMVEQIDSEIYPAWKKSSDGNQLEKDEAFYQKPVLTKTWFHTGAFLDREKILTHFKKEYWLEEYNQTFTSSPLAITEPALSDASLTNDVKQLGGDEYREALRACKGMTLRKEVFSLDGEQGDLDSLKKQAKPYSVATHNCHIQLVQPRRDNRFAVFMVTEAEVLSIQYERNEADPRIAHSLNTKIDELGNDWRLLLLCIRAGK